MIVNFKDFTKEGHVCVRPFSFVTRNPVLSDFLNEVIVKIYIESGDKTVSKWLCAYRIITLVVVLLDLALKGNSFLICNLNVDELICKTFDNGRAVYSVDYKSGFPY